MIFQLNLLPVTTHLKAAKTEKGRYYDTPQGPMPSVTTVLNAYQNKEYLVRWRKRIGEEEANRITPQAQNKGNTIHKMAEQYLTNDDKWNAGISTLHLETFGQIKPWL